MESTERRGLERYDLEVPAKISFTSSESAQRELDLLTGNISSGGAFFYTPSPLPEGTDVNIEILLNLEKLRALKDEYRHVHIRVKGKVVRVESQGMSVSFDKDYEIRPVTP